ncbi:MAG: inorganic phosphate transporter [candidate division Zixibacteria bacterium]|nr:inorganic phosphate transporter [candidate division Zixibacteria bacterium]
MSDQLLLILIIAAALMYDFVNGFHDAANAIATTIATHALSPRNAIIMARTLNFVGALLHTGVAYTVGKGVVSSDLITLPMLLAAVVGAILWGYTTWYFGLPSSSTHGLIGGLIGVALFVSNFDLSILVLPGIKRIAFAMVVSPIAGILFGMILITIFSWSSWRFKYRKSAHFFKRLQVVSAAYVSLTHGMNDAQNAMGIMTIALLSAGAISEFHVPMWVRLASAFMIGLGTSVGGWKIIKTMGKKMTKLHEPIDGCAAEAATGTVIMITALTGTPVSTTHVATSSIMGTALAYRFGNLNYRVILNILLGWVLTFPGAGLFGIGVYLLMKLIT